MTLKLLCETSLITYATQKESKNTGTHMELLNERKRLSAYGLGERGMVETVDKEW